MNDDIQPAANTIFWGILPGLQSVPMVEIMGRLPVVEDFITILNRSVRCRKQINSEESIKGSDRIDQRLV